MYLNFVGLFVFKNVARFLILRSIFIYIYYFFGTRITQKTLLYRALFRIRMYRLGPLQNISIGAYLVSPMECLGSDANRYVVVWNRVQMSVTNVRRTSAVPIRNLARTFRALRDGFEPRRSTRIVRRDLTRWTSTRPWSELAVKMSSLSASAFPSKSVQYVLSDRRDSVHDVSETESFIATTKHVSFFFFCKNKVVSGKKFSSNNFRIDST